MNLRKLIENLVVIKAAYFAEYEREMNAVHEEFLVAIEALPRSTKWKKGKPYKAFRDAPLLPT